MKSGTYGLVIGYPAVAIITVFAIIRLPVVSPEMEKKHDFNACKEKNFNKTFKQSETQKNTIGTYLENYRKKNVRIYSHLNPLTF